MSDYPVAPAWFRPREVHEADTEPKLCQRLLRPREERDTGPLERHPLGAGRVSSALTGAPGAVH